MSTPEATEPHQLAQDDHISPPGERVLTPSPGVQANQDADSTAAVEEVIYVASEDHDPAAAAANDDDEFLPNENAKSLSEGDNPSPEKKPRKSKLSDEWNKWEDIFTALRHKSQAGASLSSKENGELVNAEKKLRALLKKFPPNDPLLPRNIKILAPTSESLDDRKRKSNVAATGQTKKVRRDIPLQPQGRVPVTRGSGPVKPPRSELIQAELKNFEEQALQAIPSLERKRLGSEKKDLLDAANTIGAKLAVPKLNAWLIEGMTTSLYDYQFIGVGWAVKRERSKARVSTSSAKGPVWVSAAYNPKGGILADEMGCGKTITMLSVIMANPAPKGYRIKANLLLVQSTQMADQWLSQIRRHCKKGTLSIIRFSRHSRFNLATLGNRQIIVATYNDIERAWKRVLQARARRGSAKGSDDDEEDEDDDCDQEELVFNVTFHRLILDECQQIKNHLGATAKAVFNLKSKFQWLISATPSPNKEDEYYSYLKILGLGNTDSVREFKKWWKSPADGSVAVKGGDKDAPPVRTHLEVGLEHFQICRTHKSKIAGVEIFADVPDSISVRRLLVLTDWERILYDIVVEPLRKELIDAAKEKRAKNPPKPNQKEKVTGDYMVSKILQLYKLTAHPFLLEGIVHSKNFTWAQRLEVRNALKRYNQPNFDDLHSFIDEEDKRERGTNGSMSTYSQAQSQAQSRYSSTPSEADIENEYLNMSTQLDYSLGEAAIQRKCYMCPGETIPINAVLTECGHIFCQDHFKERIQLAGLQGADAPILCCCREPVGDIQEVDQTELAAAYEVFKTSKITQTQGRRSKKTKDTPTKRGDDYNGYQPKGERSIWLELSDRQERICHSTKTREILNIVTGWLEDAPNDKIIIFTQWIMMGKIIGRHLMEGNIKFLYYFGDMTDSERKNSLKAFEGNKDVKVIIMGLRCAGQGLDMPYANRVILVDPYWHEDGEKQAFARVLRKVQKKTTFFIRLMAEESIDMRISEIQDAKRAMVALLKKTDDPMRRQEIEMECAKQILKKATNKDKGRVELVEPSQVDELGDADEDQAPAHEALAKKPAKKRTVKLNLSKPSSSSSSAKSATAKCKTTKRITEKEDMEDAMDVDAATPQYRSNLLVED